MKSNKLKVICLDRGIPNKADSSKRIVGGGKTEVGEYPWQVHVTLYFHVIMGGRCMYMFIVALPFC